ncbi:MAG: PAS domain S-box protein [Leptolyngbya sp. DLM2.Bin15]|nr:MAG: PAS domain S-box protein [Leptolyngbya sp. DLM2.Bin15]
MSHLNLSARSPYPTTVQQNGLDQRCLKQPSTSALGLWIALIPSLMGMAGENLSAMMEDRLLGLCSPETILTADGWGMGIGLGMIAIALGGWCFQRDRQIRRTLQQQTSDRNTVEACLRDRDLKLSLALKAAKAGMWQWDCATNQVSWSEENFRLLGYDPETCEATYDRWRQAIHPEERDSVCRYMAQMFEERRDLHLDYRVLLPDGTVRWLADLGEVVYDTDGTPLGMIGIQIDITASKQTQLDLQQLNQDLESRVEQRTAALLQSEARFQRLTANMPGVIYQYRSSPDGSDAFTYVSPGCQDLYGFPADDLEQDSSLAWNAVHPDDVSSLQASIAAASQTLGPWSWEGRIITTSGNVKWIRGSSRPERQDNGDILWDGLIIDITDRKLAEEYWLQSETRFSNLAMNVPGAIFRYLLRSDGTDAVLYMSPGCYDLWEVEAQEVVKSARLLWDMVHPEDISGMYASVMESARTLQPWSWSWRITTPSGRQKWLEASGRPDRQSNGDIIWDTLIVDVSDRKQAEHAIYESERRLKTLLSNLPGVAYRVKNNPDYTPEFISEGILVMAGYTPEEFLEVNGISPGKMIHPDDVEAVWQSVQTAIANQMPYEYEYRLITKSGDQKWVWERGQGIYDDAGCLQGLEGFITDITARKQAEEELRQVLATNQAILKAIPDLILRLSRQGLYREVVPAAEVLLACPVADIVGKSLWDILPDDLAQERMDSIERAFQTGAPYIHEYQIVVEGEIRYEESRVVVCGEDEALVLVRDITDRKRSELALRDSEERLRLAVMATNQGLYDLDLQTGHAIVTPEYATMLGYDPTDFHETHEQWLARLHPDDREPTLEVFLAYVAGELTDYAVEFRQRTQSGEWKWILSLGEILERDEAGRPLRMLGIHTDITDRKQAEKERDRLIAILEASTDLVAMTDPDGQVLWSNAQGRQYVHNHLGTDDLSSLHIVDCHPEWASALIQQQGIPTAIQDGTWLGETALLNSAGSEIPVSQLIIAHKDKDGNLEYLSTIMRDIREAKRREADLRQAGQDLYQQNQRSQLFSEVTLKVRQSIELSEILRTTVTEIQPILQADRVLIYQLNPDGSGQIILEESVAEGYESLLGQSLYDPCLLNNVDHYLQGQITAITDIDQAAIADCHVAFLKQFEVRANLVVPLLKTDQLWGLLIAHQCDRPREWQDFEVEFLSQLANQVGIALAQAQLVEDLRHSQQSLQHLNQDLEQRVEQRTAALRQSEALLLEAQRVAHLGSWEMDIETGDVTWSPELFAIFGMEPAAIAPSYQAQQHMFAPQDWQTLTNLIHQVTQFGVPYTADLQIIRADGSRGYVFAKGKPIFSPDGQIRRLIGIAMDISDRKRAEQALAESEGRYKALAATVPVAIYRFDTQGQCIYVNDYWSQMTGRSADTALGDGWTRALHPDDRARLLEEAAHNLTFDQPVQTEGRHLCPDGSINWFYSQMLPEIDAMGQVSGYVGTLTDITARKQAEQVLQQTATQLEAANKELESFSYSVSHDLRAPLRHMNGFVNALQQRLKTHDALNDPKVVHYLQVIENSSQKMALLIDGLLTLSRIGRKPIVYASVPMRELVEEAIALVTDQSPTLVPIEFRIGNLPMVQGDATLLQQVLSNLISNAVKFSRTQPDPWVEVSSLPDGTLFVRDNGVGFQMDYADKLFGAFQRLHAQTDFEGTGIGLAIVQRIIHRHGGTIWAESQPNQGATFYFTLGSPAQT